jgi:pimeloyl-ACP methyl ester carboxylesterase
MHPVLKALDEKSNLQWLSCGDGRLPVRRWANPEKEKVLLLHGGSGSWLHWFRNIPALSEKFDCYALDLPGLGGAESCPENSSADIAADETLAACESLFEDSFHIVAFSWGCTVTAMMMKRLAGRLKSVMMTGPAAVGNLPRRINMKPLIKRTPDMSSDEVMEAQRENLARLMIHDRDRIDALAVVIQEMNTSRARFSSPQYARSTLLIDGVKGTETPLYVIYGEYDAPAYPELEARREVFTLARPDVRFELVADAGHWLQYEKPDLFNERCIAWLSENI